jgi:hypothetical protein
VFLVRFSDAVTIKAIKSIHAKGAMKQNPALGNVTAHKCGVLPSSLSRLKQLRIFQVFGFVGTISITINTHEGKYARNPTIEIVININDIRNVDFMASF